MMTHLLNYIHVTTVFDQDRDTLLYDTRVVTNYVTACGVFSSKVLNLYATRGAPWTDATGDCATCKQHWADFNFAMDDLRSKR